MIRSFEPADQESVRALVLDGLRERWGSAFAAGHNPDLDDIAATYVAPGGEVVVVDDAGEIVATGTLVAEDAGRGRLVRISVDAGARRRGLGRLVVAELVARARRRGMTSVVVTADTPWMSAVALYRACGFTEVAADDVSTSFVLRC